MKYVVLSLFILILAGGLLVSFYIPYTIDRDSETLKVTLNFFLSVKDGEIKKILVSSDSPWTQMKIVSKWTTPSTLELTISQERPIKCGEIYIRIQGIKMKMCPLKKWGIITIKQEVPLEILGIYPTVDPPTSGPIIIRFNSPVDLSSLRDKISANADGKLLPTIKFFNGKEYQDYTQWTLLPTERLENHRTYNIYIKEGMTLSFRTAAKPQPIKISPTPGSKGVGLYRPIEISFDEPIEEGKISVSNMNGVTLVEDKKLTFKEAYLFKPGHKYDVMVEATSITGEPIDPMSFSFTTMEIKEDTLWVEVDLSGTHLVIVRRGNEPIKVMLASGGAPGRETPPGIYHIVNRGLQFFSYKYGEGAIFWVRFMDNYLFHSIPRDSDWRLKEEELDKLGGPASHGCVRLKDEDAKWFYENVPDGTMVIIHD